MPFDRRNYPNSMKKLDKEVRDKAIDIVNAMQVKQSLKKFAKKI